MKKILVLAIAAAWGATAFAATQTLRYDITLENGKRAGEQVVEQDDDGSTRVKFVYKDNGRGPELSERFTLGADGLVSSYAVTGNTTFGSVVDEKFEIKDGRASWQSTTEKGSKAVNGPAMYVALNSSFAPVSQAIAALAARPGQPLALLPSGSLTQRTLEELQVTSAGKTRTVQLVAMTGIGLTPQFYWATTGARPRLFAFIAPGYMAMTEEGWADSARELTARQKLAEAKLLAELAARLQHKLVGLTVVRNARVFDSATATLGAPSDVYVLRGRVSAVLPAGSPVRGAVNEIDAAGRVMLPGLFDMHGHVGRWDGGLHLAAGVTTVRDMGNDNASVQQMIDENAAGTLLGPQIVPTGFLEGESPMSANNGFVVKDLAAAKNAIDWYAEHGYPQLKIYNSFPKAILKQTVAYAHLRGLHVSGHIPVGLRAHEALDAGYDEINHINQVMLNFLAAPQTDTRTLERFILPAEKVAALDFNSSVIKNFISRLKMKGTVIDPTLATFAFLKHKDGDINTPFAPVAAHMPPDVARGFHVGSMKIADAAALARYGKSYAKMVEFVGILYRAGVPIVAGTDDMAGFTLQADLVLVDGEPTKTIGDIRKVAAVITRGYLVYPHEIDKELGIVPFVTNPPQLKALASVSATLAGGGNQAALERVTGSARRH